MNVLDDLERLLAAYRRGEMDSDSEVFLPLLSHAEALIRVAREVEQARLEYPEFVNPLVLHDALDLLTKEEPDPM